MISDIDPEELLMVFIRMWWPSYPGDRCRYWHCHGICSPLAAFFLFFLFLILPWYIPLFLPEPEITRCLFLPLPRAPPSPSLIPPLPSPSLSGYSPTIGIRFQSVRSNKPNPLNLCDVSYCKCLSPILCRVVPSWLVLQLELYSLVWLIYINQPL